MGKSPQALVRQVAKLGIARADRVGLLDALISRLKRHAPQALPVLAYHRIATQLPSSDRLRLRDLFSCDANSFDEQMAVVARHFRALTFDDLQQAFDGGAQLPDHSIAITFDDGYRDNFDVALPILARHQLVGTFFVVSDYVEQKRLPWVDRAAFALTAPALAEVDFAGQRLSVPTDRRPLIDLVVRTLKRRPWDRVEGDLAELERQAQESLAQSGLAPKMIDAAQLKALAEANMAIGSHTIDHAVLARIASPQDLETQLVRSREILAAYVGRPITSLAYPHGIDCFGPREVAAAAHAGYRTACVYRPTGSGANPPGKRDPLGIDRLACDLPTRTISAFKARLVGCLLSAITAL